MKRVIEWVQVTSLNVNQLTLLAYQFDEDENQLILLALGLHETFIVIWKNKNRFFRQSGRYIARKKAGCFLHIRPFNQFIFYYKSDLN